MLNDDIAFQFFFAITLWWFGFAFALAIILYLKRWIFS